MDYERNINRELTGREVDSIVDDTRSSFGDSARLRRMGQAHGIGEEGKAAQRLIDADPTARRALDRIAAVDAKDKLRVFRVPNKLEGSAKVIFDDIGNMVARGANRVGGAGETVSRIADVTGLGVGKTMTAEEILGEYMRPAREKETEKNKRRASEIIGKKKKD